MILRPLRAEESYASVNRSQPAPVFTIITELQSLDSERYLLVGQPDHARLSGEMARRFCSPLLPAIDDSIAKAIEVHDAGWALSPFERDLQGDPPLNAEGRPQSFLQVPARASLSAWIASIHAAHEVSDLGEYMVSTHFSRIGQMRIKIAIDSPDELQQLRDFVRSEEERQQRLAEKMAGDQKQLAEYVDLLQFCDVLSLYLCCGAKAVAEFPQEFKGKRIQIAYHEGIYQTEPSLFSETPRFHLRVRTYPSAAGEGITMIAIHIR